MANEPDFTFRLNYIPKGCEGEGDFWWFESAEDLKKASGFYTSYGVEPRGWATTALEEIPVILQKVTGKSWRPKTQAPPLAIYESEDGEVAYWEMVGDDYSQWKEEWDELHSKPMQFTVFGCGSEYKTTSIECAVQHIANTILHNVKYPHLAKRAR